MSIYKIINVFSSLSQKRKTDNFIKRLNCKVWLQNCVNDVTYSTFLAQSGGIAEGHEGAVGQDCAHDHKTEHCEQQSRNIHKEDTETHKYCMYTHPTTPNVEDRSVK